MDRIDVVWVVQQPPSHLSIPEPVLDFVTRNVRVGEDADPSGAARPLARENGELRDDHRCFTAPGAGRDIQRLTRLQERDSRCIEILELYELGDPGNVLLRDLGN
ncbi:hypothetical protein D9M69_669790 [compost metagenome]